MISSFKSPKGILTSKKFRKNYKDFFRFRKIVQSKIIFSFFLNLQQGENPFNLYSIFLFSYLESMEYEILPFQIYQKKINMITKIFFGEWGPEKSFWRQNLFPPFKTFYKTLNFVFFFFVVEKISFYHAQKYF